MTGSLALGWRRRLTAHLSSLYFQNYGFYKVCGLNKESYLLQLGIVAFLWCSLVQ